MHTSQEKTCFQCLTRSEERSRGAHGAFFDFAQNEEEFDMPSTAYLILSEVEGRTTPMQCSKMFACPSAKAGAQGPTLVAHRWVSAFARTTETVIQPKTISSRSNLTESPSPLPAGGHAPPCCR